MGAETILVVDDDEDILDLIERHLSNRGYEVLTAYDGEQAISLLDKLMFDLVITDLKMPKFDGMEVQKRQKKRTRTLRWLSLQDMGPWTVLLRHYVTAGRLIIYRSPCTILNN